MIFIQIINIEDDEYPELLRRIARPPKQLYAEGNVKLLKTEIISIIG